MLSSGRGWRRPRRCSGLSQSTVSKHLDCQRCCGLIESRPVGRASVFSIAQPGIEDLLSAAEVLLDATGNAVTLCPSYGTGGA
jgi:hypothetical protein